MRVSASRKTAGAALLWATLALATPAEDASAINYGLGSIKKMLFPRAECETEEVASGDSCEKLADRCGITGKELEDYNKEELCSTLVPGQIVCCSEGDLPDLTPKKGEDGVCFTHLVVDGDNCASLGAKYGGLTLDDIDGFNNGTTWGWNGCYSLMAGINICLSDGDPPLPAPMENAICGPTKPGTKAPADGEKLEDLNPCPLNACCNVVSEVLC